MENIPILQDFVSYWGCCLTTALLKLKYSIKRGKGTADHMMPLGDCLGLWAVGLVEIVLKSNTSCQEVSYSQRYPRFTLYSGATLLIEEKVLNEAFYGHFGSY